MKNKDITTLVRAGLLSMSSHDLPATEAFKAVRLKMAVQEAFSALAEAERRILSECGIESVEKHNARQQELSAGTRLTEAEQAELDRLTEMTRRVNAMTAALREEEVNLNVKTVDYGTWRTLQNENRAVNVDGQAVDILGGYAELLLHGVFWTDPVEETAEEKENV